MNEKTDTRKLLLMVAVVATVGLVAYSLISPWISTKTEVQTIYGQRRGRGSASVNGTSVFGEMFRQRGSKISTWSQLSPRLQRSDVIVWTPNSFELPPQEVTDYFEDEWLNLDDYRFRTLIYVARDYDASMEYWELQTAREQGKSYLESRSKAARAKSDHAYARSLTGRKMESDWFSIESNQSFVNATPDKGAWKKKIDADTAVLPAAGKVVWPKKHKTREYEVLLGSEETPLIVKMTDDYNWPDAQVIFVLNGASILNLPLLQPDNRQIASSLIDECGDEFRRVTFLESGPRGLPINNTDPKAYSGFDALKIWPINSILIHLIVAGIVYCAMVFPIFGRPRDTDKDSTSHFGKHIRAMGELLAISNDRKAAIAKVKQYRSLKIEPIAGEAVEEKPEAGNPFQVSKL